MGQQVNTYTKRTKQAKDNAAIAVLAMNLAKTENDPWQKKAAMFKARFFDFKAKILQKYKARARTLYFKKKSETKNKIN